MKRDKLKGTSWKNQAGPRKSKAVVDKLDELNSERYSRIERFPNSRDHAVRVYSIGGKRAIAARPFKDYTKKEEATNV